MISHKPAKRYEYKSIPTDEPLSTAALERQGHLGWQLISVQKMEDGKLSHLFKRPEGGGIAIRIDQRLLGSNLKW
jgi:hypothetical protein